MKVILASGSPRRKELLKTIFDEFEIITADVDETVPVGTLPKDAPEILAKIKCQAVAEKYPSALTIGADTLVIHNDKQLGKPKNDDDAFNMLKSLSGDVHSVITGCCVAYHGSYHTFSCETDVKFYELSDDEILNYIKTGEPSDKAGAYGIQGFGSLLIEKIDGDYFNVVGLPVSRLKREIDKII